MDSPLVSVVIATFNMAQYLPEALRSVLCQTYSNLEVHLVDDGSTDGTQDAISPYMSDPRIHYHRQNNRGQACAKNAGLRLATGDYVAFLDADDKWMPEKLARQIPKFASSSKIGVVYSPAVFIDANGATINLEYAPTRYRGKVTTQLLFENFLCFPSAIVRRQCFQSVGMFDESLPMSIDYDLWLRLSTQYDFDYTDEPTLYYRVWPGQMSRNIIKRYGCVIRVMDRFLKSNSALVPSHVIRQAWAHTYLGRGDCWVYVEHQPSRAARDYICALRYSPMYRSAWRAIGKLILQGCHLRGR